MEEINFNNEIDLYKRLLPALHSKVKELHRKRIKYVDEKDIYTYLRDNKWKKESNLTLCNIVDDILCVSDDTLEKYVQNKLFNR